MTVSGQKLVVVVVVVVAAVVVVVVLLVVVCGVGGGVLTRRGSYPRVSSTYCGRGSWLGWALLLVRWLVLWLVFLFW